MNKFVTIGENKEAVLLVPEIEGQLAIVHLATIKRLATYLPQVHISEIKDEMREHISHCRNLEEYVQLLENELAFHKSINLITSYTPDERPDVV
jgi:hypothetical protein